jgi:hypothetical protein
MKSNIYSKFKQLMYSHGMFSQKFLAQIDKEIFIFV